MAGARVGRGVLGVLAGDRLQLGGGVGDRARDRAGRVLRGARSAGCRCGDTSPTVGRRPTIALRGRGLTIEPEVSVPIVIAARPAAAAAPEPARRAARRRVDVVRVQDLAAERASSRSACRLVMKFANSVRFVLPRITAPAARSLATTVESRVRDRVLQRDAARGRRQAGDVEVVLDQHGDAVQRAADVAGGALEVEQRRRPCSARGLTIADGVDPRPARVDRGDPVDVGARELHARRAGPRPSSIRSSATRQPLEVERGIGRARRRGNSSRPAYAQTPRTTSSCFSTPARVQLTGRGVNSTPAAGGRCQDTGG